MSLGALLLGPLPDNGGPTPTHLPLRGSPAIDTGDPSAVANVGGVPRIRPARNALLPRLRWRRQWQRRIDKGAVESDAVYFVVNNLLDGITNNVSLREAIALRKRGHRRHADHHLLAGTHRRVAPRRSPSPTANSTSRGPCRSSGPARICSRSMRTVAFAESSTSTTATARLRATCRSAASSSRWFRLNVRRRDLSTESNSRSATARSPATRLAGAAVFTTHPTGDARRLRMHDHRQSCDLAVRRTTSWAGGGLYNWGGVVDDSRQHDQRQRFGHRTAAAIHQRQRRLHVDRRLDHQQ